MMATRFHESGAKVVKNAISGAKVVKNAISGAKVVKNNKHSPCYMQHSDKNDFFCFVILLKYEKKIAF